MNHSALLCFAFFPKSWAGHGRHGLLCFCLSPLRAHLPPLVNLDGAPLAAADVGRPRRRAERLCCRVLLLARGCSAGGDWCRERRSLGSWRGGRWRRSPAASTRRRWWGEAAPARSTWQAAAGSPSSRRPWRWRCTGGAAASGGCARSGRSSTCSAASATPTSSPSSPTPTTTVHVTLLSPTTPTAWIMCVFFPCTNYWSFDSKLTLPRLGVVKSLKREHLFPVLHLFYTASACNSDASYSSLLLAMFFTFLFIYFA